MIEPVVAHSGTVPRQTRSLMYQCNPFSVTTSTSRPSRSFRTVAPLFLNTITDMESPDVAASQHAPALLLFEVGCLEAHPLAVDNRIRVWRRSSQYPSPGRYLTGNAEVVVALSKSASSRRYGVIDGVIVRDR